MLLSNAKRLKIQGIIKRIAQDKSITLEERIWMNELCERSEQARVYRDQMLKDYKSVSKPT